MSLYDDDDETHLDYLHYWRMKLNEGQVMTEDEFRSKDDRGTFAEFDYMAEADKTCSVVFNPQNVDAEGFSNLLSRIAGLCNVLNVDKKLLFRGKSCADVGLPQPALADSLAVEFDPNNTSNDDLNLLHGIIGVITEAGEMAELLLRRFDTGKFDKVNATEECGDVAWYLARQLRGTGTDFETMQRMNMDKLHGRHGEAFDIFRDANRDLGAERAKLEKASLFEKPTYSECMGSNLSVPPEPGLVWYKGCWRQQIVRDVPGLAV